MTRAGERQTQDTQHPKRTLQLLIREIDKQLLERVRLENLESENVENADAATLVRYTQTNAAVDASDLREYNKRRQASTQPT